MLLATRFSDKLEAMEAMDGGDVGPEYVFMVGYSVTWRTSI